MIAVKRTFVFVARALLWIAGCRYVIDCEHRCRGRSWRLHYERPCRSRTLPNVSQ